MISFFAPQIKIWFRNRSQPAGNRPANQVRNSHDESVSHAECSVYVRHAGIGPAFREALQLIKLIWHQPTVPTI